MCACMHSLFDDAPECVVPTSPQWVFYHTSLQRGQEEIVRTTLRLTRVTVRYWSVCLRGSKRRPLWGTRDTRTLPRIGTLNGTQRE